MLYMNYLYYQDLGHYTVWVIALGTLVLCQVWEIIVFIQNFLLSISWHPHRWIWGQNSSLLKVYISAILSAFCVYNYDRDFIKDWVPGKSTSSDDDFASLVWAWRRKFILEV